MKSLLLIMALLASTTSFAANGGADKVDLNNVCSSNNSDDSSALLENGSFYTQCRSKETKGLYIAILRGDGNLDTRLSPEILTVVQVKKNGKCIVNTLSRLKKDDNKYTAQFGDAKNGLSTLELIRNNEDSVVREKNAKGYVTGQELFDCSVYY